MDIGGTSTDISLVVDGKFEASDEKTISGYPVRIPSIDISTIGAGGYGPVSERDPELLRRELQEGIIDEKWLEEAGIVLEETQPFEKSDPEYTKYI